MRDQYQLWLEKRYPTPSFVYGLLDPLDKRIYYIGQTHDLKKRLGQHSRPKSNDATMRAGWVRSLHEQGRTFEHCVLAECKPGYHVVEMEKRWIMHGLKLGYSLTNFEANDPITEMRRRHINRTENCLTSPIEEVIIGSVGLLKQIRRYAAWSERMPSYLLNKHYDFPHWSNVSMYT